MPHPVAEYLTDLHQSLGVGVPETSGYPALRNLLNTLGGYQVLKKWLSYRESALLGRPLTGEEAQDFTHHVRRIAAIIALHPELDEHYRSSIE
jgi:hypothetical protein